MDEEKKEVAEDNSKNKKSKVNVWMRENPWRVSTIVLGLLSVLLIISSLSGGITGKVISGKDAGDKILSFVEAQTGEIAEVEKVAKVGGVYEVDVLYQGQSIPVYLTLDGQSLVQGLVPLSDYLGDSSSTTTTTTEIPKSDKPVVELFIWGYCPYGVQAQGPMAEVAELLGDYADFKTVLYYAGHGDYELQENKIQECIQEIAPEKYWDYAAGFVADIYPNCGSSRDIACDKSESIKLMNSLGINSDSVLSCVSSKGETLISTASARAQNLGVSGSPTIVVNNVIASPSSRTAEAFKQVICEAFNDAPEVCGEVLDSTSATTSGSC